MDNNMLNEIKNIDLVQYIESEGFSVKRNGTDSAIPDRCPFCNKTFKGDGHFVIHLSKNKYKVYGTSCSVDDEYGTIIDFVMKYNDVDFKEAVEILKEYAGMKNNNKSDILFFKGDKEEPVKNVYNFNHIVDSYKNNDYAYFISRGLSLDTIQKYNLITHREGLNSIVGANKGDALYYAFGYIYHYFIPLRDENNDVVSFVLRANDKVLNDQLAQAERNGKPLKLNKTHNLKGTEMIPFNVPCLVDSSYLENPIDKRLFICEGVFDSLSFLDYGKNSISANSANNYSKVLKYITKHKDSLSDYEFVLCGDDDNQGKNFNEKLHEGLSKLKLKVNILPVPLGYHDFNEVYSTNKELFEYVVDGIAPPSVNPPDSVSPTYDSGDMDDEFAKRDFKAEKETYLSQGFVMEDNIASSSPAAIANDMAAAGLSINTESNNYLSMTAPNQLLDMFDYICEHELEGCAEIVTGFSVIDNVIPFFENTITTIGAIPGAGKSTLCLNLAVRFAESKIKVLFYSLELDWFFVYSKILSSLTATKSFSTCFINSNKIHQFLIRRRKGMLNDQEKANLRKIIKYYAETIAPYLVIDDFINRDAKTPSISDRSVEAIVSHTSEYIRKNVSSDEVRPVIFVDYIQQVDVEVKGIINDKQRIDYISKKLIDLKKITGVTQFLISSLNRDSYYDVISEVSLKESGALEYGSDYLIGLQMRNMEQIVSEKTAKEVKDVVMKFKNSTGEFKEVELVLIKNRNGSAGMTMPMRFYGEYQSFTNNNDSLSGAEELVSPVDDDYIEDPFSIPNNNDGFIKDSYLDSLGADRNE